MGRNTKLIGIAAGVVAACLILSLVVASLLNSSGPQAPAAAASTPAAPAWTSPATPDPTTDTATPTETAATTSTTEDPAPTTAAWPSFTPTTTTTATPTPTLPVSPNVTTKQKLVQDGWVEFTRNDPGTTISAAKSALVNTGLGETEAISQLTAAGFGPAFTSTLTGFSFSGGGTRIQAYTTSAQATSPVIMVIVWVDNKRVYLATSGLDHSWTKPSSVQQLLNLAAHVADQGYGALVEDTSPLGPFAGILADR